VTDNVAPAPGRRPAPSAQPDEYLSPREVAVLIRVNRSTLAKWRASGRGPRWIRVTPRMVRYSRAEVENFLTQRTRTSTAAA